MVELLVIALTAAPAALGAVHGYRAGGRRLIARSAIVAGSWTAGVVAACLSFQANLFEPFGLLTPVAVGGALAVAAAVLLRRIARARVGVAPPRAGPSTRLTGALVGLAGGLAVATTSWLGLLAVDAWTAAQPAPSRQVAREAASGWLHSLVRTANRGFLRHLPVIGPTSDEIESLVFVLNADLEIRERLADERGWKKLGRLPSFRAIIEDFEILDEIDSVSEGSIAALYRLQRNSKVIAFLSDEEVQAILPGVRPSALAREIERIEARRRAPPGARRDAGGVPNE